MKEFQAHRFWKNYLPSFIFSKIQVFSLIKLSIFWCLFFVNSFVSKWSFSKFFVLHKRSHCPIVFPPTESCGVNPNFGATSFMEKEFEMIGTIFSTNYMTYCKIFGHKTKPGWISGWQHQQSPHFRSDLFSSGANTKL